MQTEEELLGDYVTYIDHYFECSDIIERNAHAFHLHSDEMDAAIENIVENGPPEIAWITLLQLLKKIIYRQ